MLIGKCYGKDYARVLFGVNDGKYVYLVTEDKDEILEHNQNLIIPTPFLKGDIVFYDSIEGREIGVLETDCSCYKYGKDLPRVVSVNRAGYLSSEIFYLYTAELAYSNYDIDVWIKLKNISGILKGNDNLKISNIFEKMY